MTARGTTRAMSPRRSKRDFLSVADFADDLRAILDRALEMKAARLGGRLSATLPGRNVAMIFEKPSTRTRTSFEVAVSDLGGHALYLSSKDLQLGRGETIADTARVLSRYVDALVYRAFHHEDVLELARWASVPVVNALDDREHPCQIVADLLTLKERWPNGFNGRRLAWVGDGNNVLNSLLLGAAVMGLDLIAATPKNHRPPVDIVREAQRRARVSGSTLSLVDRPEKAAKDADAVYTDVWVSMGEEDEKAEREKAFAGFQVNRALLRLAHPGAWVMHDLPAHRGQEITGEVIDGPQSIVWDQAENRLHAQKAILEALIRPGAPTVVG